MSSLALPQKSEEKVESNRSRKSFRKGSSLILVNDVVVYDGTGNSNEELSKSLSFSSEESQP